MKIIIFTETENNSELHTLLLLYCPNLTGGFCTVTWEGILYGDLI